jgi:hypothetical protein
MASNRRLLWHVGFWLAVMAVSFWFLWWPLLSIPSLCACTNMMEVDDLLVTREQSLKRIALNPFSSHLLQAQREWRAGLRNYRPQSYTCTGVRAIRFLGSVIVTARSVRSTNTDPVPRRRRRSRDCTTYICLHRLCTTTSNIHMRCLMWMKPLMTWASVPPHGTLCF